MRRMASMKNICSIKLSFFIITWAYLSGFPLIAQTIESITVTSSDPDDSHKIDSDHLAHKKLVDRHIIKGTPAEIRKIINDIGFRKLPPSSKQSLIEYIKIKVQKITGSTKAITLPLSEIATIAAAESATTKTHTTTPKLPPSTADRKDVPHVQMPTHNLRSSATHHSYVPLATPREILQSSAPPSIIEKRMPEPSPAQLKNDAVKFASPEHSLTSMSKPEPSVDESTRGSPLLVATPKVIASTTDTPPRTPPRTASAPLTERDKHTQFLALMNQTSLLPKTTPEALGTEATGFLRAYFKNRSFAKTYETIADASSAGTFANPAFEALSPAARHFVIFALEKNIPAMPLHEQAGAQNAVEALIKQSNASNAKIHKEGLLAASPIKPIIRHNIEHQDKLARLVRRKTEASIASRQAAYKKEIKDYVLEHIGHVQAIRQSLDGHTASMEQLLKKDLPHLGASANMTTTERAAHQATLQRIKDIHGQIGGDLSHTTTHAALKSHLELLPQLHELTQSLPQGPHRDQLAAQHAELQKSLEHHVQIVEHHDAIHKISR